LFPYILHLLRTVTQNVHVCPDHVMLYLSIVQETHPLYVVFSLFTTNCSFHPNRLFTVCTHLCKTTKILQIHFIFPPHFNNFCLCSYVCPDTTITERTFLLGKQPSKFQGIMVPSPSGSSSQRRIARPWR